MLRRPALVGLLAVLISAPLAGAPALAEPGSALPTTERAAALLRASQPNVMPGERVGIVAGAPTVRGYRQLTRAQKRRTSLVLQQRVGASWRKIAARKLKTKRVRFTYTAAANASGTVRLRTVAKLRKRTFRGGALALPVVRQQLGATVPDSLATGAALSFSAALTPLRVQRTISLQVHEGNGWQAVTSAKAGQASVSLGTRSPAHPVWYRVVAAPFNGVPVLTTEPVRTTLDKVPSLIAHRAGAGVAPEQTLAAVRQALADGATSMEIDVQLSKDGELVVLHDSDLRRTTNVETVFADRGPSWFLRDFTLAEIKQLDAGSWFGPEFAGEQVPTLDEVIAELAGRAHLVIEVKSPEVVGNEQVAARLLEELAGGPLKTLADAGKLSFSSFNVAWLQDFAAQTDVPVGVLTTVAPTAGDLDSWQPWAEEVHPNVYLSGKPVIEAVRTRGMTSSVWTIRSLADYRRALEIGADRIITDFVTLFQQVVDPPRPS